MRFRRWAIAVVAVTSLSALSACGSGDSNTTDDPSSGGSSETSSSVDTPTGSGGSEDSSGAGDNGSSSGSDVDALTAKTLGLAMAKAATDAGSAHMVMTAGSASSTARMTGDIAGLGKDVDALQMSIKMNIQGVGAAELRIVDSAFYLRVPALGAGSRSLIKVPLDDPNNPLGSVYSQLVTLTDPGAIRASFSAFNKFTDLGIEKVDGVRARHYRVTVDTVKSLKASGMDRIGGVPMRELLKTTPKQTTSDLWIDSDNRMVKMSSDPSAASSFEIHYSQWGSPVHVSAPPPSQVQPMPGL
jgi:hypothetical protein